MNLNILTSNWKRAQLMHSLVNCVQSALTAWANHPSGIIYIVDM